MTYTCRKCGTHYELAELRELAVFMAVTPWTTRLCAAGCQIEPGAAGGTRTRTR